MIRKPYEKRIKEIHSAMSDLTVQLVDCYDNVSKLKSLFHNDNLPQEPLQIVVNLHKKNYRNTI